MNLARKTYKIEEKNKVFKIINEIANVPCKQIQVPADSRTRRKHGYKFDTKTKNTMNKNIHLPMNHILVELFAESIS